MLPANNITEMGKIMAFMVNTEWTDRHGNTWKISFTSPDGTTINSITVEGDTGNLTQTTMRTIPFEQILREQLAEHDKPVEATVGPKRGRAGLSDQLLKQVAAIYTTARRSRRPVQQAVADTMGISTSAAAKRIMSARRRGLIHD